jgi:multicomponent Na+:H+ antiporter subunit D
VFAGLLTKVGVYAIVRTQLLLFPADSRPSTLILVIAAVTMLVGVLGAIAQDDLRRILSFTIVSQIGYMVMGLGFFTAAGIAAVVFSIVHHIIVKTALFLVGGLVDHTGGSSRLSRVGGMVRTAPFLAVLFLLSALSLAGIPPLSGFVAKFALVDAGLAGHHYAVIAVALVVSLLTLFSMIRIWSGVFWSPAETTPARDLGAAVAVGATRRAGGPILMVAPTAVLVAASLAVAALAGPIYAFSQRAAHDLLDRDAYISQVLHP